MNCTEDSIQQAYLSMIANAKHYVYIENQFFVSMLNASEVQNEICKVLCDRIRRAHEYVTFNQQKLLF
jgi:phospholipase D1/2